MRRFICILLALFIVLPFMFPMEVEALEFIDISENCWYYEAVSYCSDKGLFTGVGHGKFSPDVTMSRAMFVQVLYNLSGNGYGNNTSIHFLDVKDNSWYCNAIEWAVVNGISVGSGKYLFSPNNGVTREEAATFLYRYMQHTDVGAVYGENWKEFSDYGKISSWAKDAMDWAISNSIFVGMSNNRLGPKDTLSRAQMAQIMMRIHQTYGTLDIISEVFVDLDQPDNLDRYIYSMSTEELVGQVILPRYREGSTTSVDIISMKPAGVTLYEDSLKNKTKSQVISMIQNLQKSSKIPLFIAVDEEGGSVNRVSLNKNLRNTPFEAPMQIYKSGGIEGLRKDSLEKSNLLLDLGINYNLAPVCDISEDNLSYIYNRTLGLNAQKTADGITAILEEMNNAGICSALKHFPGYGSSVDTHTGLAYDYRPFQSFTEKDLIPFKVGIESNPTSVLISHNVVKYISGDRPASLSSKVVDLLRNDLGYEGIIMTDDLSMGAIKQYCKGSSPVVEAFKAGNDLLLTSDWTRDYNELLKAVNTGTISKSRLKMSVRRILSAKIEKGILSIDG